MRRDRRYAQENIRMAAGHFPILSALPGSPVEDFVWIICI